MMKKLGISLLFIFIFLSMVSATATWRSQGGGYDNKNPNLQLGIYQGRLNVTDEPTTVSSIKGNTINNNPTPLISDMRKYSTCNQELNTPSEDEQYVVLSVGNQIQVLDKDLNLVTAISTTNATFTHLTITDFDGDCKFNDIVGFWRISNSTMEFRNYHFTNNETLILNHTHIFNVGNNFLDIAPPSCDVFDGDKCYSAIVNGTGEVTFLQIEPTTVTSFVLSESLSGFGGISNQAGLSFADIDLDGDRDFLIFSSSKYILFDINQNIISTVSYPINTYIRDAKIIKTSASPLQNIIVALQHNVAIQSELRLYEYDGTLTWSKITENGAGVGIVNAGTLAIGAFSGDDIYDDIYVVNRITSLASYTRTLVVKGSTGDTLASMTIDGEVNDFPASVSLGNFNNDSQLDVIFTVLDLNQVNYLAVQSLSPNQTLFFYYLPYLRYNRGCAIADLDVNGFNDIICTSENDTRAFFSNATNINAVLNNVTFSPSVNISTSQTLTGTIQGTDVDLDTIIYAHRCSASSSLIEENDNIFTCNYATVGNYNLFVGVRDFFHTSYSNLTQQIIVVNASLVCNNNNICEENLGETSLICPLDCPIIIPPSIPSNDTIDLPLQLVNTDDINQGLLPEIYFGTLVFFSNNLGKIFFIFSFIIAIAILIALFVFFKGLASRVK